jgi:N-6 DNA Methylase
VKQPWIVVEAKAEPGIFSDADSRENIFDEKSKYIGPNTAWFVMVDPATFVARSVGGKTIDSDIAIDLNSLETEEEFSHHLVRLKGEVAGVSDWLTRFRAGDLDVIAYEKLTPPSATASKYKIAKHRITRKRFFSNLRDATEHLQDACRHTLAGLMPAIKRFSDMRDEFEKKYGGPTSTKFESNSLLLVGRPAGPTATKQHEKDSFALRKVFAKSPNIARVALEALPQFQARTGAEDKKLQELFAVESANLVLARVLLLRFFEDNGFFGNRRYLCNGGVEAFQKMRAYFEESYTGLLAHAYRQASRLYAAAFDETELDWIFTSDSRELSSAIEWSLFQFAKYDFTTVTGDILTGIYDRFLDRDKRKELGEFYTPPSIARYMVGRVNLSNEDRVFDPACGSGTFLIEAYRVLVGQAVEKGIADYSDVVAALNRICGNDLNTFSSVLAQIQLLWQILKFRPQIEANGFPELSIASKVNSLVIPDQFGALERFGELDQPIYAAVVGNPPFVRSERSAQQLDERTVLEFARGSGSSTGISASLNTYALFLYRALHSWARPKIEGSQSAGKVAFIVQVSLFDSNETAELRKLFRVGERWTILEIVDLELIYRDIFDADVLPIIIICENRPATAIDTVSIRVATKDCVHPHEDGTLPEFQIAELPEQIIGYEDIFTPDGRILSRLTAERVRILRVLWSNHRLEDFALRYWIRREKGRVTEATLSPPASTKGWSERRMITGGIAFRGNRATRPNGLDVFKGENIIATEIQGAPVMRDCDVESVDDPSIWRFKSIRPSRGFAIAQVAHCPNAVEFNPQTQVFTNTATIFVPNDAARSLPLGLLFLSNIYIYFYALAARMGVLRLCRSHVYPTNLGVVPVSDQLIAQSGTIELMRVGIVKACRDFTNARAALRESISSLEFRSLKQQILALPGAKVQFSEMFQKADYAFEVLEPHVIAKDDYSVRISLSDDMFTWVEVWPAELGNDLITSLRSVEGEQLTSKQLLSLPVPNGEEDNQKWNSVLESVKPEQLEATMNDEIHALDHVVGQALGLSDEDIITIRADCGSDPFLKRIKPRYPGTETRKQGFRVGLDSSKRYK